MSYCKKVLCAAAAVGMMGTGQAVAAEPVTLEVLYAFPNFAQFHEPIAAAFMEKHPDIKIEFRAPAPSYDDGHQLMLRAAVTNGLPDVYYSGYHLLAELIDTLKKRDQIVDLGPLLASEPKEWVDENYSSSVLSLGQVDGTQYGLAFNASSPEMYINRDLVTQAGGDPDHMPDTWPGIIELAAKINQLGDDIAGIGYNVHDWPDDWLWRAIILQAGGDMIKDGKVAFDGETGLTGLKYFRSFVTEDGMPLIDWDQSRQQFIAGKIGIFFDTPARMRQVTDLSKDNFTLGSDIFPIDNKADGGLPTGGNAVIITTQDEAKQQAAWEFLKFVTGPEAQTIVVKGSGYLPTNKLALGPDYLGDYYEQNPNFATITRQMDRSRPWQGYPGGNSVRIWRTQREIINSVMRGETTPEDGLERLAQETTALID